MMKKTNRPLSDHEKQTTPMPGEVSLEEAQRQAHKFAAQEKARTEAIKVKQKK